MRVETARQFPARHVGEGFRMPAGAPAADTNDGASVSVAHASSQGLSRTFPQLPVICSSQASFALRNGKRWVTNLPQIRVAVPDYLHDFFHVGRGCSSRSRSG